jgi:hypothetical protein
MNGTWIKLSIEVECATTNFRQVIEVTDMINTEFTRLLDDSIIDNYKKALKACGNKFDMITIVISRNLGNTYLYEPIYQYRFLGKKDTPTNIGGIEGCVFYNGMFGDFQPCDKKEILKTIKDCINKANSIYIAHIKK